MKDTSTASILHSSTSESSPLPTDTPSPVPTSEDESDTVLLGYWICDQFPCKSRRDIGNKSGIARVNLSTGDWDFFTEGDLVLEDISPAGDALLVSDHHRLFVTDIKGEDPVLITDMLFGTDEIASFWLSSRQIVFLVEEKQQRAIYISNPDGSSPHPITQHGMRPYRLFPQANAQGVLWDAGTLAYHGGVADFISEGLRWTTLDGETTEVDQGGWHLVSADLSSDGETIAAVAYQRADESEPFQLDYKLLLADVDSVEVRSVPLTGLGSDHQIQFIEWNPQQADMLVLVSVLCERTSETSASCGSHKISLINESGDVVAEFPEQGSFPSRPYSWSRDGTELNLVISNSGYTLHDNHAGRYDARIESYDTSARSLSVRKVNLDQPFAVYRMIWLGPDKGAPTKPTPIPNLSCGRTRSIPRGCFLYLFADESFDLHPGEFSILMSHFHSRQIESFEIKDRTTGNVLDGNFLLVDARNGVYAASVEDAGVSLKFHGSATVHGSNEWSIELLSGVPLGVDKTIKVGGTPDHLTWRLPDRTIDLLLVLSLVNTNVEEGPSQGSGSAPPPKSKIE